MPPCDECVDTSDRGAVPCALCHDSTGEGLACMPDNRGVREWEGLVVVKEPICLFGGWPVGEVAAFLISMARTDGKHARP